MSSDTKPNGQVSPLPVQTRFITTHNDQAQAIVRSSDEFQWQALDQDRIAMSVVYTTSTFPPQLSGDADIQAHADRSARAAGLVSAGGTVLRCVDMAPGYVCPMHRTQSLDYGVVLAGAVDMVLDSGEVHQLKTGDVAVQRATQHQWINRSQTEWARMLFMLQDCAPVQVGGQTLREDLGVGEGMVPPSGN